VANNQLVANFIEIDNKMSIKPYILILVLGMVTYSWNDGYSQKQYKKQKNEFKKTFLIAADLVAANIETYTSFEGPYGLFVARLGLEQNLGLVKSKTFFSGNALMRITKRSGIFLSYYWIHRSKEYTVKEDIPYLNEYLPQGTQIDVHFNTNVLNIGYLLTFVDVQKAFLSGYFNVYIMNLKTGVYAPSIDFDESYNYFAPIPNFGLYSCWQVAPCLDMIGKLGILYFRFGEYTEKVNDISLLVNFKPTKWLGIHAGYKMFEVYLEKEVRNMKVTAEYHFQGPAVGLNVNF
jgi:hypothetical protein